MADPYQDHPNVAPVANSTWSSVGGSTQWVPNSSLPATLASVTRDTSGRVSSFTNLAGSYSVTYDASTGLAKTISDGTTTRTISRDTSGLVTGVS